MPIILNGAVRTNFRLGNVTPDRIFMGNELVFPAFTEVTQQFNTAGDYAFNIPFNCRFLDVIVLGGGGAGQASAAFLNYGQPGAPGSWAGVTLKRGVDIPWGVLQITGTVGAGGAAWTIYGAIPGGPGGASTATFTGGGTLQGNGGAGGVGWATAAGSRGPGPGNFTWNGKLYVGGGLADQGAVKNGLPPGGAGSGNYPGGGGAGNGAPGSVWIRAY
ncbi:hypothetical protein SEA_BIANCATRI92_8 [Mycobacterium phage BiancaTri92]|nr:hypothetical protein SEA_LEOGANIA_8 [Mycobacterium phage Leogania]QGJ90908.1 hypothetical protein SEA_BIANCATRI92_8 [Mycobacterium phage BiancaTri92]